MVAGTVMFKAETKGDMKMEMKEIEQKAEKHILNILKELVKSVKRKVANEKNEKGDVK